jgi:hypothetical protein
VPQGIYVYLTPLGPLPLGSGWKCSSAPIGVHPEGIATNTFSDCL